jgi:Na+(H+)/acetate symporter ActP
MFDGLSRWEAFAWVFCLALAIGLAVSGGAYLVASSFMSADVADTMPQSAHSRTVP